MLCPIPCRYGEGDVAATANRHDGLALGRAFGETQCTSGDGKCRALVDADAVTLRVVDRTDHGCESRIDLDDFDPGSSTRSFQLRGDLPEGERR
jgi:hypothetical protein